MTILVRKPGTPESGPFENGALELIPNSMEEAYQLGMLVQELSHGGRKVSRGSRDMIRVRVPLNEKVSRLRPAEPQPETSDE